MHCWPMESHRKKLRSIYTVGNRKHKKKRLPLEQRAFPYMKRLYLSPPGMWVIWLWGGNKTRKTKKEANKSHE